MTNPTAEQVDAAVRAVLADVLRGRSRAPSPPARGAEVFGGRLLALRHVEALAPGAREVRLAPGTVVTPLARDGLKRRGIAVRLVSEFEARRSRREGEWGFAIDEGAEGGTVAALVRGLLDDRDGWIDLGGGVGPAARWVAGADDRGALVLTREASVTAWRANAVPGVRAATAADAEAVARAVRHLGMNLLVIEPTAMSISWMRGLAAAFRRGGAPTPPDGLWRDHEDRRGDRPGHALAGPPRPEAGPLPDRPADARDRLDRWLARAR